MSALALTHRPQRFADVVGQSHVVPVLRAISAQKDVPSAIILAGTRGTGKTSCARILAAALNCPHNDAGDACGVCEVCVATQEGTHDGLIEIDAASHGGVEEVARIREMCQYAQFSAWRVVVLDEAHSMSREAFNALLKMLEEPPPNTTFLLLTTEVEKILETVRSRSMSFEFRRISDADIVGRLQYVCEVENVKADPELLVAIAKDAQGGLRDALMLLDQCRRTEISTKVDYLSLTGSVDVSVPLLISALRGDIVTGMEVLEKFFLASGDPVRLSSDLMRTLVACAHALAGAPVQPGIKTLVPMMSRDHLARGVRVLWELRDRTRGTEDPRVMIEMAFMMMVDQLSSGVSTSAPAPDVAAPSEQPILETEDSLSFGDVSDFLEKEGLLDS